MSISIPPIIFSTTTGQLPTPPVSPTYTHNLYNVRSPPLYDYAFLILWYQVLEFCVPLDKQRHYVQTGVLPTSKTSCRFYPLSCRVYNAQYHCRKRSLLWNGAIRVCPKCIRLVYSILSHIFNLNKCDIWTWHFNKSGKILNYLLPLEKQIVYMYIRWQILMILHCTIPLLLFVITPYVKWWL